MKKIFTLPLLLIVFHMSLRAQSYFGQQVWRPIASSPGQRLLLLNNTGRSAPVLTLDTMGHPYIFYIEDYVNPSANSVGGQVLASYFEGTNWNTINPSLSSVPDRIAGVVDRSGNAYLGYNDLNQLPEVEKFAANTWSPVGTGVPQTAPVNSTATPVSITTDAAGTPWYAIYNTLTGSPSVYTVRRILLDGIRICGAG